MSSVSEQIFIQYFITVAIFCTFSLQNHVNSFLASYWWR